MTKKIYIIDWDETIPKTKTGGILDEASTNERTIKKNTRFKQRTEKLLNDMHKDEHFVVFIGRKLKHADPNPAPSTKLAMLYCDFIVGKKREFLNEKDVYIYAVDKKKEEQQSELINEIILRFNRENPYSYILKDDFKRVVIVGSKATYSNLNNINLFSFIDTDYEDNYLTQLEADVLEARNQTEESYLTPKKSFWEAHKSKIISAGIATLTLVGALLGLILALTSVVCPPSGIAGGFLIGATFGFILSSVGFGTAYCCTRNSNYALYMKSLSTVQNLSTLVIDAITNGVRNEASQDETMPLNDKRKQKYQERTSVDLPPTYGSPIHVSSPKHANRMSKKPSNEKEEIIDEDNNLGFK